jgi:hypothetical protein
MVKENKKISILDENHFKILQLINNLSQNRGISIKDLAKIFNYGLIKIMEILRDLKNQNLIFMAEYVCYARKEA